MQQDSDPRPDPSQATILLEELKAIRQELEAIRRHPSLERYQSRVKMIFYGFVKGVMTGFGTVIGATIIVSLFIYFLSQVEFVPIIGEWLKRVIEEIELSRRYSPR